MGSWFSELKKDPYGTLNPEQIQVNKSLGNTLLNNIDQGFQYGGNRNAAIDPGTQDVIANNARINAVAGKTYADLGDYNDPKFNEQFNSEIADPQRSYFMQNYERDIGQEIPYSNTGRANMISRGYGDMQNQILQKRFEARESAKDRALNALTGSANYFQTSAGIQEIPRTIKQAGLDRDFESFIKGNEMKQNSINQALQFLGISTGSAIQEPTTFGNIMATAQGVANIASSFQGGGSGTAPGFQTNTTANTAYPGGTSAANKAAKAAMFTMAG